jgi:hypothetical protein
LIDFDHDAIPILRAQSSSSRSRNRSTDRLTRIAGSFGARRPQACARTQDSLTPSHFATSGTVSNRSRGSASAPYGVAMRALAMKALPLHKDVEQFAATVRIFLANMGDA